MECVRGTLGGTLVERVVVWVIGGTPPTDADWDAAVEFSARVAPRCNGILVWADSAPNSAQRAKMTKIEAYSVIPTAIVSSSAVVRGVATAFSWLGKNVKRFSPSQIDEALDFLGVAPQAREVAVKQLDDLRARFATRVAS